MRDQIVVLLALSAGLFAPVSLEKVADGVTALRGAAANMPGDVVGRLTTASKLSDGDKKILLDLATEALAPFRPLPAPDATPRAPNKPGPDSKPPSRGLPPPTKAATKPFR